MKLALVCSWLNQFGGAERVLEVVHGMYPQAPLFTSVFCAEALPATFRTWDIRPSFLNKFPLARRWSKALLPLYPLAFESLDLRTYDVVLSITSGFAHGVLTAAETQHVCYCLTPARFLWNYHAYVEREGLGRAAQLVLPLFLKALREWDRVAADRVDQFIAISRAVQRRILKYYHRDSTIIYPPVNTSPTSPVVGQGDSFLIVSRLVPYKRIDLAVRAFNALGLPLDIIGEGRDGRALRALAKPNIRFLGRLPDAETRAHMARCRALVFPGDEDFGITPLEVMSEGRPVIAYAAGGALDTVDERRTGLFFREPTPESLAAAVCDFEQRSFDPETVRQGTQRFATGVFQEQLAKVLEQAERTAHLTRA